jgi:hypothetical protein
LHFLCHGTSVMLVSIPVLNPTFAVLERPSRPFNSAMAVARKRRSLPGCASLVQEYISITHTALPRYRFRLAKSMTTKEKSRQILSEVEALALPPRRSARHQSQTLPTGSSSRPITIPDSPPLLLNYNAKDNATTNIEKENELIQVIPKLEFMGTRHARQIEGINQDKDLIKLIQDKQAKLLKAASQIHGLVEYVGVEEAGWEKLKGAVDATLVFAQEEAVRPSSPFTI